MKRRPKPRSTALYAAGLLAIVVKSVAADGAINLSQFQEISGFPINCENAYNAPIQGCTQSDFSPADAACSQPCFNGLQTVTTNLNNACGGLSADPSTLIGLFFEGKGAQALCPTVSGGNNNGGNNGGGNNNGGGDGGAATTIIGATTLPPSQPSIVSDPPPPPPAAATSTIAAAVTTAPATAAATTAASSTSSTETFVLSSSGASMSATVRPFTSKAGATSLSAAVAGTETSSASQTTGAGSFGGGAIPFTVSSSSAAVTLTQSIWVTVISTAATALACVFVAFA